MGRARSGKCCQGGSRAGVGGRRRGWARGGERVMAGPKGSGVNLQGSGIEIGLWEAGALK